MLETFHPRQSMIRKSGYRFSEKFMLKQKAGGTGCRYRRWFQRDRGKFQGCFNSTARGYTMPVFTFEKISPPIRRGPLPPIAKKQRGVIVKILDRFVEARVKRTSRKEKGVTARRQPKPQE
jgi:hypothetical protein